MIFNAWRKSMKGVIREYQLRETGVFRNQLQKPNLHKTRGVWWCTAEGKSYAGYSPKEAWLNYERFHYHYR